jgi:hypothetical protein
LRSRRLLITALLVVGLAVTIAVRARQHQVVPGGWKDVTVVHQVLSGRQLPVVLEDDQGTLFSTDRQQAVFFRTLRELGVQIVRISSDWSVEAPRSNYRRPPSHFDATDPNEYPRAEMFNLDRAVRAASAAGLTVDIDAGFYAPLWATRSTRVGSHANPYHHYVNPTMFAAYAAMLARRYDGHFTLAGEHRPLPRVDLFELWNEPNLAWDFSPQTIRGQPVSPEFYRRLVELAYPAIKRVNPDATVLIGNTSSSDFEDGIPPLTFIEQFACVNGRLRPITSDGCEHFDRIPADGFAHHPYEYSAPPWTTAGSLADAQIGELGRLQRLLDRLVAEGRLAPGAAHLWLTEAGYQSNQQLRQISRWTPEQQALFLADSEYEAWTDPQAMTFAQFLLNDSRVAATLRSQAKSGNHSLYLTGTWTTGLETQNGVRKPAFWMIRTPVVARTLPVTGAGCHALEVWGRFQPDDDLAIPVAIQFAAGPDGFSTVANVRTGTDGVVDAVLRFRGTAPARVRLMFSGSGGTVTSPAALPGQLGHQRLPAGDPAVVSCS